MTERTPAGSARAVRGIRPAWSLVARTAPGTLLAYVLLTLAGGVLPVLAAWLTKLILDGLVRAAGAEALAGLALGLAGAGVLTAVTPHLATYLHAELDRAVGLVAQDRLFAAVDGFTGLARFEDPRFLDRLRLAQQAAGTTPGQVVDGVLGGARSVLTVAGFLGSLFVLSPPLTLVVLAAGVPVLVAEVALARRRARVFWTVGRIERREFFYGDLLSSVEAAKEIRLFGTGTHLRGRLLAERRAANAAKRAVDRRESWTQSGLGLLAGVVAGGGLLWAVTAAVDGRLSVGDLTILVAGVAGVQAALTALAGEVARAHQALLMFDHYTAVTGAGDDLVTAAPPRPLPPLRHGIELRNVWFRYSEQHPWVLRGVDLWIPCGRALALVGLNGAGKSTLVKLLCRFYDPTRGAILWDGVDLRDVEVTRLRQRIGAVFQDYMRYDLTAAENIGLGELDLRGQHDRLRTAAERAGVHDEIAALPQGYDTLLSRIFFSEEDRADQATGTVLSGGQWQRLALARAFLRDQRDLMILDEPSSGLDAEAEHEIHTSLRRHRDRQTSLLISHRLSAVRDADLIVVLRDGRVVEQADHVTLMARGGEYARLFSLQAAGYQATRVGPAAGEAQA
ncbi:multidrug ABC transporter permease [Micromonospora rosaria]|uniref:Multidrug ABC transporter permease n=1 Tax=Micromonospora rosaria TaxID=47874 RepID=A0A136PIX3_9ACTN|nr:ABC transporter ATP-binding protein [Micromonospora rosaria]KXK58311.1 multidrug ABC transporter permease [Micromonospora rosaria]